MIWKGMSSMKNYVKRIKFLWDTRAILMKKTTAKNHAKILFLGVIINVNLLTVFAVLVWPIASRVVPIEYPGYFNLQCLLLFGLTAVYGPAALSAYDKMVERMAFGVYAFLYFGFLVLTGLAQL